MDKHGHPWSDLPGRDVTDHEDPFGTGDGHVPVDEATVLVAGPRWARRLTSVGTRLSRVARLLGRILAAGTWTVLGVVGLLLMTGHAEVIGLSETTAAYRPVHLALVAVAVLVIGFTTGDVTAFGRRNRAVARVERTREERIREERLRELRRREDAVRRTVPFRSAVDGLYLPDNPDLIEDPNGFTGTGTQAPGAQEPGVYSPW